MLYSVRVIDDKSEEGFPLRTSFGRIFTNQGVGKIVVSRAFDQKFILLTNYHFADSIKRKKNINTG